MVTAEQALKEIHKMTRWGDAEPDKYATEGGWAGAFAEEFQTRHAGGKEYKPHQLRKIFGHVKRIDTVDLRSGGRRPDAKEPLPDPVRRSLMMLLPQAAYDVGRNLLPRSVYDLLRTTLQKEGCKLTTVEDFDRFVDFLSSVVAYQKYRAETSKRK